MAKSRGYLRHKRKQRQAAGTGKQKPSLAHVAKVVKDYSGAPQGSIQAVVSHRKASKPKLKSRKRNRTPRNAEDSSAVDDLPAQPSTVARRFGDMSIVVYGSDIHEDDSTYANSDGGKELVPYHAVTSANAEFGNAAAQDFVVASFATAIPRAYLTRNGRETSSRRERKPTVRDGLTLPKQMRSQAPIVSSRTIAGRVGKSQAQAETSKTRKPQRTAASYEHDTSTALVLYSKLHESSAEEGGTSHPKAQPEPTAAQKVFGIFELCEMVVSNLSTHDLFRTRGVNRAVKETIESSKACKEKLFLATSSKTPVTWLEELDGSSVHPVPFMQKPKIVYDYDADDDDEIEWKYPYWVHQPWLLNTMLLRHGLRAPWKHTFQRWPRQTLNCSACTFANETDLNKFGFDFKTTPLGLPGDAIAEEMFLSQPPARSITLEYSTTPLFRPSPESTKVLELHIEDGVRLRDIRKALKDVGDDQKPLFRANLRIRDAHVVFPSEATFRDVEVNGELICSNIFEDDSDRVTEWREPQPDDCMTDMDKMTLEDAEQPVGLMAMRDMQQSLPEVQDYSFSDPAYTFRYARSRAYTEHGSGVKENISRLGTSFESVQR